MRVVVTVDRPIGYNHKGSIYTVNYGYVSGVIGGDGHWQDAYILDSSISWPVESYSGSLIAVVVRDDDNEAKWIVSNENLSADEIYKQIEFIERFFKSRVHLIENYPADKL